MWRLAITLLLTQYGRAGIQPKPGKLCESCELKRKCCYFDEIFFSRCNASWQNDNFQCRQWWKFRRNDIFVSASEVYISILVALNLFEETYFIQFPSFLSTEMAQVVDIISQVNHGHVYPALPITFKSHGI